MIVMRFLFNCALRWCHCPRPYYFERDMLECLVFCLQIEHVFAGNLDDVQIQGAKFISDDGRALAITGYDSHELFFYRQTR